MRAFVDLAAQRDDEDSCKSALFTLITMPHLM